MGYFLDMLREEFKDLKVNEIYSTQLGNRSVEILEVSAENWRFLAMFQSEEKKGGVYLWSLIITSPKNTRTIQGMDRMDTLKLRIRDNIKSMIEGLTE
ncbi:hypothetical protein PAP_00430 [Palaeococcus pacificus DY20341]|uniref:Uncharacterized protein n=1 Tax=Palaeococcus pacificus DY20341 TaxID=1343739 RepID=A0A075LVP1_9EURY|nr:hypothetical protein [Palaeococcus pacificus]AIF68533.1 hypothetical protein PAP_00430 [Palaeococcus pacificus DY20341]